jgi:rhodanese-related sulfurtransferase
MVWQTLFIATMAMVLALLFNRSLIQPLPLFTPYEPENLLADESRVIPSVSVDRIDLDLLLVLIAQGDVVLLDARPPGEFAKEHIPEALNLPLGRFDEYFPEVEPHLAGDRIVVVYCSEASCPDAANLAIKLIAHGHGSVKVFQGGMAEWNQYHASDPQGEGKD